MYNFIFGSSFFERNYFEQKKSVVNLRFLETCQPNSEFHSRAFGCLFFAMSIVKIRLHKVILKFHRRNGPRCFESALALILSSLYVHIRDIDFINGISILILHTPPKPVNFLLITRENKILATSK